MGFSFFCICEKKKKMVVRRGGHKSQPAPGGTSRKTETLKAGGIAARGRKANISPRRTCSGSCRMLQAGPGQEVCLHVCMCVSLDILGLLSVRASVNVSADFCLCTCHGKVAVCAHAQVCVCVRARVNTLLSKVPSQTPLLWGGNGQ